MNLFRKNRKIAGGLAIALFCLTSCFTPKKVVYLQDLTPEEVMTVSDDYASKIKKDDLLQILVLSNNAEAAKPFNLSAMSSEVSTTSTSGQEQGCYLVDADGCIEFPVFGRLAVVGNSTSELRDWIKTELMKRNLIKDPIVTVRIMNFKVMMLGEVKNPGAIEVKGERLTLLDAISQAGDLTLQGRRDRVAVIREEKGKRTVNYLDLKSKDIFESPYFYLQQNDVVYVEPNDAKSVQYRSGQMGNVTPWISLVSSVLSLATLIVAFK